MQHAFIRLSEELRVLVDTWKAIRINISLEDGARANMERQTKIEIAQTFQALKMLASNGYGPIPVELIKIALRVLKPVGDE